MIEIAQKFKKEIIACLFLYIIIEGLNLSTNLMNTKLVDNLVQSDFEHFFQNGLILITIFVLFLLFQYGMIRYKAIVTQRIATYLRNRIALAISKTSYEEFYSKNSQKYISWFTSDIDQIEKKGISIGLEFIAGMISVLLSMVALACFHWSLIVATLVLIVCLSYLPKLFMKELSSKTEEVAISNEEFSKTVSDLLSGYETLFVFRKFNYFLEKINNQSTQLGDTHCRYSQTLAKVAIAGGVGNVISQVSIFLLTGYLILQSEMSVGSIVTTTALASTIFNMIANISQYVAMIQSTEPLLNRFKELKEGAVKEASNSKEKQGTMIAINNLSFSYQSQLILRDISLNVTENKKYVLLGESGSGKSTLMNLISGKLSGYIGEIIVDGIDVNSASPEILYEKICYISQKPHLFSATIRENLCFDKPVEDEKLFTVLERVGLKDTVLALPNQLDTVIGDKNTDLSGGQLQRIAFARGLMKHPKVFLLDEVSSNLDEKTTIEVLKPILEDKSVTVLWVTHHLPEALKENIDQTIQMSELNQTA